MDWINTPEYGTMYHDLPRSARFWWFLFAVGKDLAEKTRANACTCGGPLTPARATSRPFARGGGAVNSGASHRSSATRWPFASARRFSGDTSNSASKMKRP